MLEVGVQQSDLSLAKIEAEVSKAREALRQAQKAHRKAYKIPDPEEEKGKGEEGRIGPEGEGVSDCQPRDEVDGAEEKGEDIQEAAQDLLGASISGNAEIADDKNELRASSFTASTEEILEQPAIGFFGSFFSAPCGDSDEDSESDDDVALPVRASYPVLWLLTKAFGPNFSLQPLTSSLYSRTFVRVLPVPPLLLPITSTSFPSPPSSLHRPFPRSLLVCLLGRHHTPAHYYRLCGSRQALSTAALSLTHSPPLYYARSPATPVALSLLALDLPWIFSLLAFDSGIREHALVLDCKCPDFTPPARNQSSSCAGGPKTEPGSAFTAPAGCQA